MWRGEVDVACVFLPLAPGCPARRRRPAAAPPAPRARGRRRHRPRIAVDTAHANTQASLSPGPSLSEKASPACSHSARTRREKAKPQVDLFTPRPCPSTRTTRPAAPRRSTTTTATAAAIAPWSSCSRPTSECGGLRERGGVPRPTFFDRRAVFLSPRVSLGRGLVRALNRARADEGTTRTRLLPTLDRGPGGRDTARARARQKPQPPHRQTSHAAAHPLSRPEQPSLSLSTQQAMGRVHGVRGPRVLRPPAAPAKPGLPLDRMLRLARAGMCISSLDSADRAPDAGTTTGENATHLRPLLCPSPPNPTTPKHTHNPKPPNQHQNRPTKS